MVDVRLDALRLLTRLETGRRFAQDLIAEHLSETQPDPRDGALLAEIVYGVVRHRLTLDTVISTFSNKPLKKLDPKCLTLLRMGLYQILFLDRIPAAAAVHESVKLARPARISSASGFVNAVLRAALRALVGNRAKKHADPRRSVFIRDDVWADFRTPVLPDPAASPSAYLAAAYSHPEWLVKRWLARWGEEETVAILRADNQVPPLTVRVNRLKTDRASLLRRLQEHGIPAMEGDLPLAVRLGAGTKVVLLPSFGEGLFQVQDEMAMRSVDLLNPQPGETILDLCAAPGGKTTQIAEYMNDQGTLLAADRSAERLQMVEENVQRLGLTCVRCVATEESGKDIRHPGGFDRVLVDAPCSNTGVLARRIEARWRLDPKAMDELVQGQMALLRAAAELVRPGGIVLYSTCSIEEEENERLVAEALKTDPITREVEQTFLPSAHAGGGYIALLRRKGS